MNVKRFRWGIREKLTLLFFGVTLVAVTVNFLMVVPRLELRLRSDRVKAVKRTAQNFELAFNNWAQQNDQQLTAGSQFWDTQLSPLANTTGGRVAVLRYIPASLPLAPQFSVLADPSGETKTSPDFTRADFSDPIAGRAVASRRVASGVNRFGSGLHAEAASPIIVNGTPVGAVVYTTSLANVSAIVQQQARRNLVAAVIALSIALVAGLLASSYIARRIRRLERAAREVSMGNFTEPLPVDSSDEIGELARAFNTMQDRLGRADRARKAFIANASHELRTPLFSLGGYVELLREEDLDPETQREFLEIMHKQIERMTKLATDLLDLSKLDTGSLDLRREIIDVNELARGVAREFGPLALEHDSELSVQSSDELGAYCDPDRVAQIVRILIDNALSHTPPGTAIELSALRSNGSISLAVSDDGPGIPESEIPRIFDRFHTGDKTGGTGLGLSIANELAQMMESQLVVNSSGEGTTFTLHLPAEAPSKGKRQPAHTA